MFRYLLDSNVVITFQRASCLAELAAAAATVGLAIVDDVEEELTQPPRPTDPVTAKMKLPSASSTRARWSWCSGASIAGEVTWVCTISTGSDGIN